MSGRGILKKLGILQLVLSIIIMQIVFIPVNVKADTQAVYYVSPAGNDSNSGTSASQPFKTIEKARNVVRTINSSMTGDIIVYLMDGTYSLTDTITFGNSDSGTNGYNIIYRAYTDSTPVISGGTDLSGGWTLYDSSKNIYRKTGVTGTFRQLFVNGNWAIRARSPNLTDTTTGGGYYTATNTTHPFTVNSSEIGSWAGNGVCEFHWVAHWSYYMARIDNYTINGSTATINFKSPESGYLVNHHNQSSTYYYYENAYELLDAEGEWFLDTASQTLYYKPRADENMSAAGIIAPGVTRLLNIAGDSPTSQAHNIQFYGITFKYDNWTGPSTNGYIDGQGGQTTQSYPGGLDDTALFSPTSAMMCLTNAKNIRVERNIFTLGSSWGIMEFTGSNYNTYVGNTFTKLASGAINVGNTATNTNWRQMPTGTSSYDLISNNLIDDVAHYYMDSVGILAIKPKYLTITHNVIRNLPYTGISLGFEWDDTGNQDSHDNTVSYNRIYNCMRLLSDGAGIYSLGKMENTSIDHNYIYNLSGSVYNGGDPIAAVYLDNGSCYKTVQYNVVDNVSMFNYVANPPIHDNVGTYNYYKGSLGSISGYSSWVNNSDCTGSSWPQAALDIIAAAGLESSYRDIDSSSQVIAEWCFNGNGSDSSGYGNTATLHGSPSYNTSDNKEGNASLSLNGSGQYASASLVTSATDNLAMSAWVKWNGGTGVQFIINNGNSASNGYGLELNSGVVRILCGNVGYATSADTLSSGQWTHLAAVRRNGSWELYVNGSPVSLMSSGIVPYTPNGVTTIGGNNTGGECFNGLIDDVRIYSGALVVNEINAMALSFSTGYISKWGFNGNASDYSGYGHDATLYGTPSYVTSDKKEGTSSLSLNGNGQYCSSSIVTAATNNITMSAWVKWNGGSGVQFIMNNGNSGSNGYGLQLDSGTVRILCGYVGYATSSATLTSGQWTHLTAVRRNGVWELYINGSAVTLSGSGIAPKTPNGVTTVGANNSGLECFAGLLDDIRIYTRALSTSEISALTGGAPTDYAAEWGLNGNASDTSGNSYNATLYGNPSFSTSNMTEGSSSIILNGSSQYASSSLVATATDNITMSAWVKWNGGTGVQFIVNNGNSSSNGYGLELNSGVVRILCGNVGYATSSVTLASGQWTHLSIVRRSGNWELYINGISVSLAGSSTIPYTPSGVTTIGSNNIGGECLNGNLDDVRIYTRALTASEVSALAR